MPPMPPLVTPLRPYKCQLVLLGFEKMKQLLWQMKTSFLNFQPKLDYCVFKVFS